MAKKIILIAFFISMLFLLFFVKKSNSNKNIIDKNDAYESDSFSIILSGDKEFFFTGKNIYPNNRKIDTLEIASDRVYSILLVDDTLVIIANDNVFTNTIGYSHIDSVALVNLYEGYDVYFDDELPYYAWIHNKNDSIIYQKNWEKETPDFEPLYGFIKPPSTISICGFKASDSVDEIRKKIGISIPFDFEYKYIAIIPRASVWNSWFKEYIPRGKYESLYFVIFMEIEHRETIKKLYFGGSDFSEIVSNNIFFYYN